MTTNLDLSRTATSEAADTLTAFLYHARAAIPPAANGKPPRSANLRAAYLRSQVGAHKMQPFHTLLAIVADDLACGVPASEHLAWIDRLRAEVEALAVRDYFARRERVVPIEVARESVKETTLEGKCNPAQERWALDPDNVAAITAFVMPAERQHEQLGKLIRLAHTKLALLKSSTSRRVYGAGRSA